MLIDRLADVLGEACGADITERLLLPTVIGMSSDSVANVRCLSSLYADL